MEHGFIQEVQRYRWFCSICNRFGSTQEARSKAEMLYEEHQLYEHEDLRVREFPV